jgi:hypothetical protein
VRRKLGSSTKCKHHSQPSFSSSFDFPIGMIDLHPVFRRGRQRGWDALVHNPPLVQDGETPGERLHGNNAPLEYRTDGGAIEINDSGDADTQSISFSGTSTCS